MAPVGYSAALVKTRAVSALVGLGLLASVPAWAAGEGEWQLALRAGPGTVSVDDRKPWGLVTALDLEYGLNEAWALRATVAGSIHPVDRDHTKMPPLPGGTVRTVAALAGLTYTIDVLRLVPYGHLEFGAIRIGDAVTSPRTLFAAELGIGADYFLTRRWTTGISFQYLFAPKDLLSDPTNLGSAPFAFSATWRVARIF
jgi:hypothetical protein